MMFQVSYEVAVGKEVVSDVMLVEAESEERAVEFAAEMLDQQYDESVLLECQVVK